MTIFSCNNPFKLLTYAYSMAIHRVVSEALDLNKRSKDLLSKLQDYSKSQRGLWTRVPRLAFEADGRNGFSEQYSMAYDWGLWDLEDGSSKPLGIRVLLWTGEIVESERHYDPKKSEHFYKIADTERLRPLRDRLGLLDAKRIVSELEVAAKTPYPSYYNPAEQEAWRTKKRNELSKFFKTFK